MKLSIPVQSFLSMLVLSSRSATGFVTQLKQNQLSSIKHNFSTTSISSATLNEPTTATLTNEIEENEVEVKSYLDDGFVFGLEGSGLSRPKGKVSQVVVEGDSLETQPYQLAGVSLTFINHALVSSLAISQLLSLNGGNIPTTVVQSIVCILSSWVFADLGSGILHWSVDNYGNGKTPVMGNIIAAFQGHHSAPWTITEREMCNNIHKLCIPFGIVTIGLIAFLAGPSNPLVTLFFTVFCSLEIMSQEFHKWAHMTKSQTPALANTFQDLGLTINRKSHALHHLAPYDGNYCIVSGVCNEFLDKSGVFRMMEHAVYKINGVESNAWKIDGKLRSRTLRGEYQPILRRGGR